MENKAIYEEIGKKWAPMELEGENPEEMLEGQEGRYATIRVGWKNVKVFLVPAPQEVCEDMMQALNRKYSKDYRKTRCMVPGIQNDYVRCPECNKCEACPYGTERESFDPRFVSYDDYIEENLNTADPAAAMDCAAELADILRVMEAENPISVKVLNLHLSGYSEREIAEMLRVSPSAVHRALVRAHNIARRYRDGE
ncbi:MAG: hypothetical protein IKT07_10685 [Oscillospiraceae bacterium]|nr:hypothetical protein [Oscillospiraceae bacterium]